MKTWNLRGLLLLRSLMMVVLPMWFMVFRTGGMLAWGWLLLWGAAMLVKARLEGLAREQTDESAQAMLDKIGRNTEQMSYSLIAAVIVFLTQVPKADDPGLMALRAAQVLAWGIFAINLYRGLAFWFWDRKGTAC